MAEDGTSDWNNLPTKLREHERNSEHISNVLWWVDLQSGHQKMKQLKKNRGPNRQRESSLEDDNCSNNWSCEDNRS